MSNEQMLREALERCLKVMELTFAAPTFLTNSVSAMNGFCDAMRAARSALAATRDEFVAAPRLD